MSDPLTLKFIHVRHTPDGLIRLVGGFIGSMGYVEVAVNGSWGAVCGDSFRHQQQTSAAAADALSNSTSSLWTVADAKVACRQLGLPWTGAQPFSGQTYFVSGPGPGTAGIAAFLMSRVQCMGNESSLQECLHYDGVDPAADCTSQDSGRLAAEVAYVGWGRVAVVCNGRFCYRRGFRFDSMLRYSFLRDNTYTNTNQ